MSRAHINATRDRAYQHIIANHPGSMQWQNAASIYTCGITISSATREQTDGGFSRIRTATVIIAKSILPTLPELEQRANAILTQLGNEPQTFRFFEAHEQSENHWLLRFAKYE